MAPPTDGQGASSAAGRCARSLTAGAHTVRISFGGISYPVRVHIPSGVPRTRALPLVLDLRELVERGLPGSDLRPRRHADREHFIVVNPSVAIALPRPTPPLPDGSFAWNVPNVPTTAGQCPPADARNDIAYLTRVINTISRSQCVDARRVYPDGYSGGGRMASALACARPDKIAATAPISGLRAGRPSPVDTSVPELQDCTPASPVAVIPFHGDADFVNPYPGNGDLRWGYPVSTAVQSWARIDGCRVGPQQKVISEHVVRFRYAKCAGRSDVVFYKVLGGGHTWPGTSVDLSPLGVTTQEISASELLWAFFDRHPRKGS